MILKRCIIYLSIVLLLFSCNKFRGPKKPDNLISKEKMVDILIDAKLLSSVSSINRNIMKKEGVDFDNYVYLKHHIDSLQFALSNNYYAYHVKDYEEIYNKVNDSLNALKTFYKDLEAKEWKERTKSEEDSLKAVLENKRKDLKATMLKDSLREDLLKNKPESGLVEPISDTDFQ